MQEHVGYLRGRENDSSILLRVILAFWKFWFITVEENVYLILLAIKMGSKKEE